MASLNVNVSVAVALAPKLVALLLIVTVGAVASMVIVAELLATVLVLPAVSVWRTLTDPVA
jgi:hypothetical protein